MLRGSTSPACPACPATPAAFSRSHGGKGEGEGHMFFVLVLKITTTTNTTTSITNTSTTTTGPPQLGLAFTLPPNPSRTQLSPQAAPRPTRSHPLL
ncbi:hypothetical protein E2C01_012186 [Portunus trituberculatus]|uniref:Uncharacterized protein n=1 Tax=Portunus trituberculatus TaxID=210409 RepID=A0A5B7DDD4_PORTR|nr:hypothetical protein [Portunus trituberculatus]